MAKKRGDKLTIDMWTEFEPPVVAVQMEPEVTRGGTLDVKISLAISHALRTSNLDRKAIASQMSEYLGGQNVTENMLDQYASSARKDHKITLERFVALVAVTGCHDLLGFVAGFSDFAVVPAEYLDVINASEAEDFARKAAEHSELMQAKLKSMRRRV